MANKKMNPEKQTRLLLNKIDLKLDEKIFTFG